MKPFCKLCLILFLLIMVLYFYLPNNPDGTLPHNSTKINSFQQSKRQNTTIPLVLIWNDFPWKNTSYETAICKQPCEFSKDKYMESEAIVISFYLNTKKIKTVPDGPASAWRMHVFVIFESPSHTPLLYKKIRPDYFNLTATYRQDSDFFMPYDSFVPLGINKSDQWTKNDVR